MRVSAVGSVVTFFAYTLRRTIFKLFNCSIIAVGLAGSSLETRITLTHIFIRDYPIDATDIASFSLIFAEALTVCTRGCVFGIIASFTMQVAIGPFIIRVAFTI